MYRRFRLLFAFLLPSVAFGQIGTIDYLEYLPGPGLYLNSGAFTALPSDDPFAAWANPAQISNIGSRVRAGSYATTSARAPYFRDNTNYHSYSVAAGKQEGRFQYGVGLIHTGFNSSPLYFYEPDKFVTALSAGIGVDLGLQLNTGITIKSGDFAPGHAFDLGMQLTYPTPRFMSTSAEISVGYALRNLGGMVDIHQFEYTYPRSQSVGYSLALVHHVNNSNSPGRTVRLDVSVDIHDTLVEPIPFQSDGPRLRYTSVFDDIRLKDHLILRRFDERIKISQGWRLHVFDTFRIGYGWTNDQMYFYESHSKGYEIDLTRILKFTFDLDIPISLVYSYSNSTGQVHAGTSYGFSVSGALN